MLLDGKAKMNNDNQEISVSIITPIYNGERYIGETIESVLKQNYENWEILIIDDGSVDHSFEIAKNFEKSDARIHVFHQENKGSAAARNYGIRNAKGKIIALLDADDIWEPDFLEKQVKFMKEKNASCAFCAYKKIDENSKEIFHPTRIMKEVRIKDMRVMNRIGCLTGLYDTTKYGKVYLHEDLKSLRDDYAYWYDVISRTGISYGNPEVLAKYRVMSGTTTGKKSKLIRVQYNFYRNYIHESRIEAVINLIRWAIAGIIKFS
jgi:glycosyltransferase involved in cell wall biosynthesis